MGSGLHDKEFGSNVLMCDIVANSKANTMRLIQSDDELINLDIGDLVYNTVTGHMYIKTNKDEYFNVVESKALDDFVKNQISINSNILDSLSLGLKKSRENSKNISILDRALNSKIYTISKSIKLLVYAIIIEFIAILVLIIF